MQNKKALKIAVTVCDCSHVVHAGGEPHRVTSIVELTDAQVPANLRRYLNDLATAKEHERYGNNAGYVYQSVTISLVETEDDEPKLSGECEFCGDITTNTEFFDETIFVCPSCSPKNTKYICHDHSYLGDDPCPECKKSKHP